MIDLTALKCALANMTMLDWGTVLEPPLGGVSQRIDRIGTRFSQTFRTPTMRVEADGRRAIALLQMAKQAGARVLYPQLDFNLGAPGAPVVSGAHTGGTALAINGAQPNYVVRFGQALSLTVGGRGYLHFSGAECVLDAAGAGTITLTTPMRRHLAGGEPVNLAAPVLEGWLAGTELPWSLDVARTTGLEFTVTERG